jgi:hypothetical protein
METLGETLVHSRDWAVERIDLLTRKRCEEDAFSIVQEFAEWLDPDVEDHDIFSLEYIGEGSEYE